MKVVLACALFALPHVASLRVNVTVHSRRAALAQGAACGLALCSPALASAVSYRPSLAEFKGQGSSPYLDEQKEGSVQTTLTLQQLVENSARDKMKMLGRELTEEEFRELIEKVKKFYPDAK